MFTLAPRAVIVVAFFLQLFVFSVHADPIGDERKKLGCDGNVTGSAGCKALNSAYKTKSGSATCESSFTMMNDCCKNWRGRGCPLDSASQQNVDSLIAGQSDSDPNSDSLLESVSKDKSAKTQASEAYQSLAGACRASKAMCMEKCNSKAGSGQELQYQGCEGAESFAKSFSSQAASYDKAAEEDDKTKDKIGSKDSKDGGGGSGSGSKKSGDSKSASAGGAGGMPAGLDKLLQAMMQKPPETPPQQPPANQQAAAQPTACPTDGSFSPFAHCQGSGEQQWEAPEKGTSEMATASEPKNARDFVVPDVPKGQGFEGLGGDKKFASPPTVAAVPSGGTPLGGAAGAGAASLGAAANAAPSSGAIKSAAADVMRGLNAGGGYSQLNAAMGNLQTTGGGGGGYNPGSGSDPYKPMNLAAFLPKTKEAARKLAGVNSLNSQIRPASVNIWNRVSECMRSRCNSGRLRDCVP